jgi:hypothetical protein
MSRTDWPEDRFVLTAEHVKLLRASYTWWDDMEFGAAAIDPKRPYGNSDVLPDLRELLPGVDDDDLLRLHRETETALEVALRAGSFEPGEYVTRRYFSEWRPR